ncbi:MAG: hypothetical protein ABI612_08935 [Betaproteobacteria bacterium]
MARKLVLCASSFHLTASLWTGRRLSAIHRFDAGDDDQPTFSSFLRAARGVPVYLMADTVDEDYRFETLPHAFGKDRRQMVERKLKQLYRSTPFYGASLSEREEGKRRDDRYLLAALTNPAVFEPWLRIIVASGLPVAGVFPLPVVTLGLAKKFDIKETNLLLVSKHEAGIRQTFLKNQRFRISRLTPLRASGTGGSLESYAEEIRNTRMYLDALNVMHVDDILHIVIVDQDATLAPLGQMVQTGRRNLRAVRYGPEEIVAKVGVDAATLQASPDALHLYLLGQKRSLEFNLAPPPLTSGYTRYVTSRSMYTAAGAVAALAGVWCAMNLYQTMSLKDEAQQIASRTRQEQSHYLELTRSFPPSPVPSAKLQQTVDVAERIGTMSRMPDSVFRVVSAALEKYPAMRLNGLQWRNGGALAEATAAVTNAAPTGLSQSTVLQIELTAQPGDFRSALVNINNLVRELGRNDSVAEVKVIKMPLNLASTGTLAGTTSSQQHEQPQNAQFDVELVMKPGV